MKLPVGNEPVLGTHLLEVHQTAQRAASSMHTWYTTINNSGPTYTIHPGADTTTAYEASLLIPRKCTLTNLCIKQIGGTDTKQVKYTVLLNLKPTAITLALSASNSTAVCSALKIPVEKLDMLTIQIDRPNGNFAGGQPTQVLLSYEII